MIISCSKGEWKFGEDKSPIKIFAESNPSAAIANVYLTDPKTRKRTPEYLGNAQIMIEAGNVTNECGLSPRQLLEQRNELFKQLKDAASALDYAQSIISLNSHRKIILRALESTREVLANIKSREVLANIKRRET